MLWKQLSAERKLQAADDFWKDDNARLEQAEVIGTIAQRIKFRTKSVQAMPGTRRRNSWWRCPPCRSWSRRACSSTITSATQRPMMGSFLDALGIGHEEGLIADEEMQAPRAGELKAAAATSGVVVSGRRRRALPLDADVAGPGHLGRPGGRPREPSRRRLTPACRAAPSRIPVLHSLSGAFAWTSSAEGWIALLTLTALEIVLGIDNIIFISILAGKLPRAQQRERARNSACRWRCSPASLLLLSIAWMMRLPRRSSRVFGQDISGRDLILLGRRPVPDRQEHARDPRQARRRRGHGSGAGARRRLPASSSRSCCSTSSSRSTR